MAGDLVPVNAYGTEPTQKQEEELLVNGPYGAVVAKVADIILRHAPSLAPGAGCYFINYLEGAAFELEGAARPQMSTLYARARGAPPIT